MNLKFELYTLYDLIIVQFRQIFPYWIAGTIVGSILSVYAADGISRFMLRIKKDRYSIVAALAAAILGVVSPVCMYGTIPLIAVLGRKGVPQYILATFMISSVMLNPNLFLLSFALGTDVALIRLFSSVAAGLTAGILVKKFYNTKQLFNFSSFETDSNSVKPKKTFFKDLNKSITITAPYFLIGILITALFDRYFPKGWIYNLFGSNRGFGVLLAASLGVPVYVCGGGTIPLIRTWLSNGMSMGSAAAFMLTGPATKLTNLSAVKIVLGKRSFIIYIVYSIGFAIITGFITDLFYR